MTTMTLLIVSTLCASLVCTRGLRPNGLIVPSYFWPTDANWDALLGSLSSRGVARSNALLIMNANNGVIGSEPESTKNLWRTLARDRIKPVAKVICYINLCNRAPPFPTCGGENLQGARPSAETLGYVDDWIGAVGLENIDGFFLDDTPMDGANSSIKDNILTIVAGIKARKSGIMVITNPGVAATDIELLQAVSSTIYDEGPFPDSNPPPKTLRKPNGQRFPKRKFAMILNSVPASDWSTHVETARTAGYFYFYATDASYADLPPYLDDMITRIAL